MMCDRIDDAVAAAHSAFLYGLFEANAGRRRFLLWQWLQGYEPNTKSAVPLSLLRETWYVIVRALLSERDAFVVENTRCLLMGPLFPVRYEWLTEQERHYLVHDVFRHRRRLFSSVKVVPPAVIHLSGFKLEGANLTVLPVWRRQLVRDLASWMQDGTLALEFSCAVQRLALERGDRFLCEVYASLQGHGPVSMVPCFGLGPWDPVRAREELEQPD